MNTPTQGPPTAKVIPLTAELRQRTIERYREARAAFQSYESVRKASAELGLNEQQFCSLYVERHYGSAHWFTDGGKWTRPDDATWGAFLTECFNAALPTPDEFSRAHEFLVPSSPTPSTPTPTVVGQPDAKLIMRVREVQNSQNLGIWFPILETVGEFSEENGRFNAQMTLVTQNPLHVITAGKTYVVTIAPAS